MHELDAEAGAIGSLQDIGDLPDRRVLEAEHVVDEDRPVEIAGAETVGRRVEFRLRLRAFLSLSGSRSAARWPRMR